MSLNRSAPEESNHQVIEVVNQEKLSDIKSMERTREIDKEKSSQVQILMDLFLQLAHCLN